MIRGIGCDIVQISRLNDSIVKRVLTPIEQDKYHSFTCDKRRQEYLAGRFALKEAIIKALTQAECVIQFQDIVIDMDSYGKPLIQVSKHRDKIIHGTISHELDYAIAFCVVETSEI